MAATRNLYTRLLAVSVERLKLGIRNVVWIQASLVPSCTADPSPIRI